MYPAWGPGRMTRGTVDRDSLRRAVVRGVNNGLVGRDRSNHVRAACSFTRETWTLDSPPVGADRMAESTSSTRRLPSPNCHQRFGAEWQVTHIQGGGAMQRR